MSMSQLMVLNHWIVFDKPRGFYTLCIVDVVTTCNKWFTTRSNKPPSSRSKTPRCHRDIFALNPVVDDIIVDSERVEVGDYPGVS